MRAERVLRPHLQGTRALSMKRYALLLGVLAALPLAPARAAPPASQPADQSIPVNFNILPGAQHQGQPVKRAFTYTLARGQSLSDTLMIVNPSKTASLTVKLSVSDAVTRPQ